MNKFFTNEDYLKKKQQHNANLKGIARIRAARGELLKYSPFLFYLSMQFVFKENNSINSFLYKKGILYFNANWFNSLEPRTAIYELIKICVICTFRPQYNPKNLDYTIDLYAKLFIDSFHISCIGTLCPHFKLIPFQTLLNIFDNTNISISFSLPYSVTQFYSLSPIFLSFIYYLCDENEKSQFKSSQSLIDIVKSTLDIAKSEKIIFPHWYIIESKTKKLFFIKNCGSLLNLHYKINDDYLLVRKKNDNLDIDTFNLNEFAENEWIRISYWLIIECYRSETVEDIKKIVLIMQQLPIDYILLILHLATKLDKTKILLAQYNLAKIFQFEHFLFLF